MNYDYVDDDDLSLQGLDFTRNNTNLICTQDCPWIIGWSIFSNTNLTSLDIRKDDFSMIGGEAFSNCKSLTSVKIKSCEDIIYAAFMNDTNLKTVILPEGLSSICKYAFKGCSQLDVLEIPQSVHSLGSNIVSGNTTLRIRGLSP